MISNTYKLIKQLDSDCLTIPPFISGYNDLLEFNLITDCIQIIKTCCCDEFLKPEIIDRVYQSLDYTFDEIVMCNNSSLTKASWIYISHLIHKYMEEATELECYESLSNLNKLKLMMS